jgi:hypothetical protein
MMSSVFSFWGGVEWRELFLSLFSSCSHQIAQVPNLFPKAFPIAPQYYPIWFAQSSTLMYINWKRWNQEKWFPSKTWFNGIYLNFQRQKSL